MPKLSYEMLYKIELKLYKELADNYSTLKVEYDDLLKENKSIEKDFQELSDKYFTLKTKYDDICEKYSVSETLRHVLFNYIKNN